MALTARQRKFIDAYLLSGNATRAAVAAGYSEATAKQQGSRLLTNADVCEAVNKRQQKASDTADLTLADHLAKLNELRDLASGANQLSAAVSAEVSRGKAAGLYVEKRQHSGEIVVRVVRE